MDINKTPSRIHPLVAGAAVAVILASVTGIAAMTGLLPNSLGSNPPTVASAAQPATAATQAQLAAASTSAPASIEPAASASSTAPAKPSPKHRSSTSHVSPTASAQVRPAYDSAAQAPSICESCGRVESVQAVQQQAQGSGLGVAAGAIVGGVLGHQVGGGNGRTLATVAGAVGGGFAGNEVEKRARASTSYQVKVRMENGHVRTFTYAAQPAWGVGDRVRVVDGRLTARA